MRVPFPAYEPLQLTTHERTRAYGRPDFSQTTTSIRRLYARDGYVLDKRRRNGGISSLRKNLEIGALAVFLPRVLGRSGCCEQTLT